MEYESKEKLKRFFIFLGFIAVVLVIGYLLYAMFFKTPAEEVAPEEEAGFFDFLPFVGEKEGEEIITPDEGEGGLIIPEDIEEYPEGSTSIYIPKPAEKASSLSEMTDSYSLIENVSGNLTKGLGTNTSSNSLNYYDYDNQKFYKINEYGESELLSDKEFYKVQDVTWSPVDDKAILEYPDGKSVYYDFSTDRQYTLPDNWYDFAFDGSGTEIAFKEDDIQADYRWLSVASPDGSNKQLVQHLGINAEDVQVGYSPNQQIIAQYPVIDNLSRSQVYFLGANDENFNAIYVDGADVRTEWSPTGTSLLASAYSPASNFNPQLEIITYDLVTNEASGKKTVNVQTWADKCTYKDDNTILCAVPTEMVTGAGMQPDVMKFVPDHLYEIDVQTGATKRVVENLQSYTMTDLTIGPDGNLYFIDQNSGTLNKVYLD